MSRSDDFSLLLVLFLFLAFGVRCVVWQGCSALEDPSFTDFDVFAVAAMLKSHVDGYLYNRIRS